MAQWPPPKSYPDEPRPDELYYFGDCFRERDDNDVYMLCQIGSGVAALIGLRDGNRWDDGIQVELAKSQRPAMYRKEFNKLWGTHEDDEGQFFVQTKRPHELVKYNNREIAVDED